MKKVALSMAGILGLFLVCIIAYMISPKVSQTYTFVTRGWTHTDPLLRPIVTDMQMNLASQRVDHNGQCNIEDIHVGDILMKVTAKDQAQILITKAPYEDEGVCVFDYILWEENPDLNSEFICTSYCSDNGMVEYDGPLYGWNPTNYLTPSAEAPLSFEEVQLALQGKIPAP